jgi:hypothetical protein
MYVSSTGMCSPGIVVRYTFNLQSMGVGSKLSIPYATYTISSP